MDNKSVIGWERRKNSSKLNEQRGNVYENKGPLWKTGWQSGNVIENKGTYAFKAGMLLKIKVVSRWYVIDGRWCVVGGGWGWTTDN
jgi:hypothetical protein